MCGLKGEGARDAARPVPCVCEERRKLGKEYMLPEWDVMVENPEPVCAVFEVGKGEAKWSAAAGACMQRHVSGTF
jgi:hypothetical protein